MKYFKLLLFSLTIMSLGCTLISTARGITSLKKLQIRIDNVVVKRVSLDGIDTNFHLIVKNPNSVKARIVSFEFDALFNNRKVARGSLSRTIVVDAQSDRKIIIPVHIPFEAVGEGLKRAILEKSVEAGIVGYVLINTPLGRLRFKVLDRTRKIL